MKFYGGSTAFYGAANAVSFYEGGPLSSLVPDIFPVSIDGRPYMVDLSQPFYRQYRRQIAPLIRTQADTSKTPGEQSLDPNGLWRRSLDDWSGGAGQRYLDRDTSIPNGFWQSKGVDTLTSKWQISLLPDTSNQYSTTGTNLHVVAANGYTYISDGQSLKFTSSLTGTITWTTVTGTPAATVSSICTDGYQVYACYGGSGLYVTAAGAAGATQLVTSSLSTTAVCGYVNGRLMVASGQSLYNVISGTAAALPTPLMTTNNPNSAFVGFAQGNNNLYAAVNIGGVGFIYGTATTADGSALTAPTVQATLPGGETVTSVYGYLGQLVIGTSLGVRYAQPSASGGISIGALITGTQPNSYGPGASVQCLYGYGRWVWFGWTNYDGTSTGLGKLDLENFVVDGVLPAMSSDRMATAQGLVTGVAVVGGVPVFAVSGVGVFVDSTNLVASGSLSSGYILYDLADRKIASLIDVETVGTLAAGSYEIDLSVDGKTFSPVAVGTVGQTSPASFSVTGDGGGRFEIRLTLNRDATATSTGPTITRWTLRAYPAPRRPVMWQLPLILSTELEDNSMGSEGFDPLTEVQALEEMAAEGAPVTYQESKQSYQVFVQDVQFLPDELTSDKHYFNGLALVTIAGLPVPN